MKEKETKAPPAMGRPQTRLYCLPDGQQLTYTQLKEKYSDTEREAIVKRCKRMSQGYILKKIK